MRTREFWKTVGRLTVSGIDGYARDQETARLQHENTLLRTLATELRVPLPTTAGGYREIVVQRWHVGADQWAVTDGTNTNRKVWVDDGWRPLRDLMVDDAFRYTLDDAITLAQQVVEHEGAGLEARFAR
jgi:hypothetical protein